MAEPKTTKNRASVDGFLAGVDDERRRSDALALRELMVEATGVAPAMWGPSIVGFGQYSYEYESGRQGTAPAVGFSPRKQNLAIYLSGGLDRHATLLDQLGKHSTGKGCLYVRRLSDVDQTVLGQLVRDDFTHMDGKAITPGDAGS